jgi:2-isopropylmalate synthase
MDCIPSSQMHNLTRVSKFVNEVAGIPFNEKAPYVGGDAFSHKGGMHIDAVNKNPISYEHIVPTKVGNERHTLVSEVAGRSALLAKLQVIDPALTKESEETKRVLAHLKTLEHEGYQFENAEQSFDVRVRKLLGKSQTYFTLDKYNIHIKEPSQGGVNSKAEVAFVVNGEVINAIGEGDGPVNALDKAMRNALREIYPAIKEVKLTDYKVRVLDSNLATAAKVRVMIESSDANSSWNTIGVSTDITEASWIALQDAIEYKLMQAGI